jgi:hypothetical protein
VFELLDFLAFVLAVSDLGLAETLLMVYCSFFS